MPRDNPASYLKVLLVCITGLLLAVAGFNLLVDPFWVFDTPTIAGFSADKTQYYKHTRMAKAHQVRLLKPGGIILGTSRAEHGLDPEHPGWEPKSRPVFNLALSSGRISEALAYLQHANSVNRLNQVVLAVDFFMFDASELYGKGYDETRLDMKEQFMPSSGWIKDLTSSLLSIDALIASVETVRTQGKTDFVPYRRNGFHNPGANWNRIQQAGGHRAAMLSNLRYDMVAEDGWSLFRLRNGSNNRYPTLKAFRELVEFCIHEDIRLVVLISPVHVIKLEVLYQFGLWDEFEYWKRELTRIVADARRKDRGGYVELWDFTGYNSITTEPFPAKGDDQTRMRWYWEGSHYRKEAGDLVLDRVLNYTAENRTVPAWFGVKLSPDMIDDHLDEIRRQRNIFASEHTTVISEVTNLIEQTAEARKRLLKRRQK